MNDNFKSRVNSALTSKESYDKQRVRPDTKHSYTGWVFKARQANKALCNANARIKADEAELRKTYTDKVVAEKMADAKAKYNQQVKMNKEKLISELVEACNGKRNAIQEYVTAVPPDDISRLIQTIQIRINAGGKIGESEWNMFVRRVSDSGSYQALAMLNDIAIQLHRDFTLPFNVDDNLTDIDNVEKMLLSVAEDIEKPESEWGYWQMAFLSDTPNNLKQMLENLDTSLGATVAEKEATRIDRLKESAQVALHAGKDNLFRDIYAFIAENRDQLMTAEEIKQEVADKAEQLIAEGMSAGEE